MRAWWSDTLSKRIFVLLWVALVGSHLLGFAMAHWSGGQPMTGPIGGPGLAAEALPSLPPGLRPGPGPGEGPRGGPGDGPPPFDDAPEDGPMGGPPIIPASALWLDYSARILVIGLAAWLGARWLSAPMRRLAAASQALGSSLSQATPLPRLDERRGTLEVRQTAEVFNRMAERLRQQFDTRSLYMAALSHDLRTPMTRMRMRLEQRQDDALMRRCVDDLHQMDTLINAVLDALRDERAPEAATPVDVHALVQSLADDLVEQGDDVQVEGRSVVATTAPTALRRVVANLVGNALRYGGNAKVAVIAESGQVRIVIDDNGPGISEDQLEAVFQPFHRLEASRSRDTGGIGLGLYIARDLSQRHGIGLELSNRTEGGLRAELRIPLSH